MTAAEICWGRMYATYVCHPYMPPLYPTYTPHMPHIPRRGHSTETLLLHLLSDIYGAVDSSQLTLLALFDVSAAFDTFDHEILLKRLEISFGLSGNFLSWVGSFLSERSLCVVHAPSRSAWVPAPYGLPQGSVLGPLLYNIYASEIGPLLSATSVLGHLYANDIQAYLHCPASNATVPFWRWARVWMSCKPGCRLIA